MLADVSVSVPAGTRTALVGGEPQRLAIAQALLATTPILLLDGGRVLARSTRAELLDSSPLYRELATHQLLAPAPAVE